MSQMLQNSIASTNFELPFDLVSDILSRLPVKPLLRFKSVCKTWYTLIQTPNFIQKHQTRSKQNSTHSFSSLLVTEDVLEWRVKVMWLRFRHETRNPIPSFLFQHYPCILGICDGLVCVNLDSSETIICNPTTGRLRVIPEFSLPKIELDHEVFGFGFKDNDYKLFRFVDPPSSEFSFRVEVYSMNTNMWIEIEVNTREIDTRVRIARGFFEAMPVAISGVFYWKGHIDRVSCVVSFDTNRYVFGMIVCPEEIITTYRCYWRIADFNEELALTTCRYRSFEMWVLNEKERSWTMKHRVEDLPCINQSLRMLGCDGNGNLVMQHFTQNLDIKLFLYDPVSHEIMYLPFAGLKQRHEVYLYTESLLSV